MTSDNDYYHEDAVNEPGAIVSDEALDAAGNAFYMTACGGEARGRSWSRLGQAKQHAICESLRPALDAAAAHLVADHLHRMARAIMRRAAAQDATSTTSGAGRG